jgi:hypothetical protein
MTTAELLNLRCRCGHLLAQHLPATRTDGARPCRPDPTAIGYRPCDAECEDFRPFVPPQPKAAQRQVKRPPGEPLFPV